MSHGDNKVSVVHTARPKFTGYDKAAWVIVLAFVAFILFFTSEKGLKTLAAPDPDPVPLSISETGP